MSTKAQQVRLGMFLVGFVVLLFGGLIFIAGSQFWEKRDEYTIHFTESVAGLDVGSQVKVNGVSVGRVESVTLNPEDIQTVIVEVSLTGGIPLHRDAAAVVQLAGITGLKYIEVDPGSSAQPLLRPGSRIQPGASTMTEWTGRAEDIARQVQAVLARVLQIADDDNMARIDSIIESIDRLMIQVLGAMRTLNDILSENRSEVGRLVKGAGNAAHSITKTSDELASTIRVARDDLHGALTAGERAANRVDGFMVEGTKAVKNVGGIVEDARDTLTRERIGEAVEALTSALQSMTRVAESLQRTVDRSQADLTGTLEAIREASEQLEEFSRTIRDNPGALLRSSSLPEEEVPR